MIAPTNSHGCLNAVQVENVVIVSPKFCFILCHDFSCEIANIRPGRDCIPRANTPALFLCPKDLKSVVYAILSHVQLSSHSFFNACVWCRLKNNMLWFCNTVIVNIRKCSVIQLEKVCNCQGLNWVGFRHGWKMNTRRNVLEHFRCIIGPAAAICYAYGCRCVINRVHYRDLVFFHTHGYIFYQKSGTLRRQKLAWKGADVFSPVNFTGSYVRLSWKPPQTETVHQKARNPFLSPVTFHFVKPIIDKYVSSIATGICILPYYPHRYPQLHVSYQGFITSLQQLVSNLLSRAKQIIPPLPSVKQGVPTICIVLVKSPHHNGR
mmetsp:Transcript_1607/g.9914  ORF Transcript_1607/g.9914 Transcript_1607/m.9914 type:complete len:321 (+) Transcript_1607:1449-2411(+)